MARTEGAKNVRDDRFYFAEDVAELMRLSKAKAYKIIQNLNKELQEQGKLTERGRVPRQYFEERYYL